MARGQKPRLPLELPTLQPRQVIPGGVARTGAPIGVGSNARAIAGLLSETSAKLKGISLTQKERAEEEARIAAQDEFLDAKRSNTLDLLRKATLEGQLPEGMSPSYNDYRKVLLAKDAIENSYQAELNANIGMLVDPDVDPNLKATLLQNAYTKTGIDDLDLDPISKGIVLKSLSKVQQNFDSVSRQRAVEVNLEKMQRAIDKDTINVLKNFDGDEDALIDSITTSIDIAKKAAVKEPTKQILSAYLKHINTIAGENPDKALSALDAIEDASLEDGAPLAGNIDIAATLVKSRDTIENTIHQDSVRARRELDNQRNSIIQQLESKLTTADMDDPEKITEVFDSFLAEQEQLPPSEQVPLTVANGVIKERDALVDQARKVRNGDTFEVYAKQQELDLLSKTYSMQATNAENNQQVDDIINDINSRDYLTVRDKARLIGDVTFSRSAYEFSSGEYDPEGIMLEAGITPEVIENLRVAHGGSSDDMDNIIGHVKEFGVNIYTETFNKSIKEMAQANNMTVEQAMTSNKSRYVSEDDTDLPDGAVSPSGREGMVLDNSNNLVKMASDKAKAKLIDYLNSTLQTNATLWKVREQLANDAVTDSMSAVSSEAIELYKDSSLTDQMAPEAKGLARNAIVMTRGNLMRMAEQLKGQVGFTSSDDGQQLLDAKTSDDYTESKKVLDNYYKTQNMLGYSLKEIIKGETLAKLPIDYSRIDPATTRIVWNKRELEVLKNISDREGSKLATKFGVDSVAELIFLQQQLMEQ